MQRHFWGPSPGDLGKGQKVKYHLISITKSISKIFYTKLCVRSHKYKIKNIIDRIFILSPGSCPRGWTLGRLGYRGGQSFFQHCHVAYQIDGDDGQTEQNASKLFILGSIKLVILGEVKRSNIIKFRLPCRFQRCLYQTLCVFSQINDSKTLNRIFVLLAGSCPRGGTWGCWGQKL